MFLLGLVMSVSTVARADQCAWVSKATADAALKYLQPHAAYATLCEPCGEKGPTYTAVDKGAVVRATPSEGLYEVVVDGNPVDLAYVYVVRKPEDKKLGNLAFLVDCPTTGVSKTIPLPVGE